MQSGLLCWMLLFAHTPMPGTAADVGYQLDVKAIAASDGIQAAPVLPIEFEERVWTASGVEQATEHLPLIPPFVDRWDFRTESADQVPSWLDDVAWPLTRQLFHRSNGPYCFGGVTCQR
jgi:hypothetical protein